MDNIKNIIFDFGGVLLNLDKQACINAFVKLGMENVTDYLTDYRQNGIFRNLEVGEISPAQFRDQIRNEIGKPISDKEIDDAWMQFLLDIPEYKLDMLLKLRSKFRTFMLSNTNAIHIEYIISRTFGRNGHVLSDYFEKVYYSHEIGYAKPDEEIYNFVIKDTKIISSETLFIDDAEANIAAAKKLGFKTYQPKPYEDFSCLFVNCC